MESNNSVKVLLKEYYSYNKDETTHKTELEKRYIKIMGDVDVAIQNLISEKLQHYLYIKARYCDGVQLDRDIAKILKCSNLECGKLHVGALKFIDSYL